MARNRTEGSARLFVVLKSLSIVCSVVFAVVLLRSWWHSESSEELLARARQAAFIEDFRKAEKIALEVSENDPLWVESRLAAGEFATRSKNFEAAMDHYRSIPQDGSADAVLAAYSLAEICRHVGLLTEAEANYRTVLTHQPDNVDAHSRLAFLLGATGQRWEALPHYFALVRLANWTIEELTLLADLERPHEHGAYLARCEKYAPDDLLVNLGVGAFAILEKDVTEARRRLRDVVVRDPDRLSAQAMLGELLLLEDNSAFQQWLTGLPPSSIEHPEIWLVRGLRYRQKNQLQAATRCFWEAVRLEPNHRRANYQLGQSLIAQGREDGQVFISRADLIFELTNLLDLLLIAKGQNRTALRRIAEIMRQTGRPWEAWAWATTTLRIYPDTSWAVTMLSELEPELNPTTPRTLPEGILARKYDFSTWKLPQLSAQEESIGPTAQFSSASIRFEDEAIDLGIKFSYFNGDPDPEKAGARMQEQTGGGIAVLDYDGDGWPDLFFSQGSFWPEGSQTASPSRDFKNSFFRNDSGRRFIDLADRIGLADKGFGQGATVGDFDSDGFLDLYVANIGKNRLYRNNGDGTFSDVTETAGLHRAEWTSSCVMTDFNADGHPDLFDVNYVQGKGVFTDLCGGMACSPKNFQGVPDGLLISRGDGTFDDIQGATPTDDSKGLGVVAVTAEHSNRPSLFISNDQVPNFFLANNPTTQWPRVRLDNEALVRGIAYNEDGLAMACMGIAVGDADGNGLWDLYVTNFRNETNTLYLQDTSGFFVDSTKISGLASPSYMYVGWGTQFVDVQRDGFVDLIVTNGHVEDYRSEGRPYHMFPQLYLNRGQCRFTECDPHHAGSFFANKYLGRGLARLDWNRDGLMDFAVSNINANASLATNATSPAGHYLNIRLIATQSARDAVGTKVRVAAGGNVWTQQLIAGDGYMASNERVLQFGLGAAQSVDELTVDWPSGTQLVLRDPPVDVTLDLVEDADVATVWRNRVPDSLRLSP